MYIYFFLFSIFCLQMHMKLFIYFVHMLNSSHSNYYHQDSVNCRKNIDFKVRKHPAKMATRNVIFYKLLFCVHICYQYIQTYIHTYIHVYIHIYNIFFYHISSRKKKLQKFRILIFNDFKIPVCEMPLMNHIYISFLN